MTYDEADLADALAAAGRVAAHEAQRLADGRGSHGGGSAGLDAAAARVLEAAGGQEVGNSVRTHLERRPAAAGAAGPGGSRDAVHAQVLEHAEVLYREAHTAAVARLTRAGLLAASVDDDRRAERTAFVTAALADRRDAVERVLAALRAAPAT